MPLARISIPDSLSATKTRALADAVHDGLVATCDVPPTDRFQLVLRYKSDAMIIDPHFPDVNRTHEAVIIEILFIVGRTVAQKKALYRDVAARAVTVGFSGDDIMIALTENAATDWSAGGGRSFG